MPKTINPRNYRVMINILKNFVEKGKKTCEELTTACSQHATDLWKEDVSVAQLTANATSIITKYQTLAVEAKRIAAAMQEELDTYLIKEGKIWNDEITDDF